MARIQGCVYATAFIVAVSLAAGEPEATVTLKPPTPANTEPAKADASQPSSLSEAPKLLLKDTVFILAAPSRWEKREWLEAGGALTAVVGTALLLDGPVRDNAQAHRNSGADKTAKQVQLFGAGYSFAVIGGFYAYGKFAGNEEAARTGYEALEASLISGALGSVVKIGVGRSRPSTQEGAFHFEPFRGGLSFPSGHTTQAFAVATVIAEHYPQFWVRCVAYGTAALVGASRIEQNAHFTSDVVAGAILGTLVGRTVVRLNTKRNASGGKGLGGLTVALAPEFGPGGYRGAAVSLRF